MLTDFALEDVPVGFKGSVSLSGCESSIVNGPLSVPSGLCRLVYFSIYDFTSYGTRSYFMPDHGHLEL